ncbi:MAG: exodeoxyribonuclease VII small subunit [bacterium]
MTEKSEFNFEESMERLENIVEAFDSGEMTLRQMETSFTEGMSLIKKCSAYLDEVDLRVRELSAAEQGTGQTGEDALTD